MENTASFILTPPKAKDLIPPPRFAIYFLLNFSNYINFCKTHISHLLHVDDNNKKFIILDINFDSHIKHIIQL